MLIGRELENPFGTNITDIDMDLFIRQLKIEVNIITSKPAPKLSDFVNTDENVPLGPKSKMPYSVVKAMSIDGIGLFGQSDFIRNTGISEEKADHGNG
jgi:hypothetical protein